MGKWRKKDNRLVLTKPCFQNMPLFCFPHNADCLHY